MNLFKCFIMSENICRLCLTQNEKVVDVFCDIFKEGNVREKILKYLYINIKDQDIITKCICMKCLEKLENFHTFCNQVEQNQQKFLCPPVAGQSGILFETDNKVIVPEFANISKSYGETKPESAPGECILYEVTYVSDDIKDNLCITATALQEDESLRKKESNKEKEEEKDNWEIATRKSQKNYILTAAGSEEEDSASNDSYFCSNSEDEQSEIEESFEGIEDEIVENDITEFPKVLIKDSKLIVKGKKLVDLMTRFYKLKCDLCPEGTKPSSFSRLSTFFSHYNDVHSINGYVVCCGIQLIKPRAMALHMARHLQPDAFKCPECEKMMTCPKILRYHIQNHLPEEKRPLACPKCPRRFSYSSALTAHQIVHLPEDQKDSRICDECGKTFSSAGRLSKHINSTHVSHCQQYVCHECGKQFSCKGNLSYHLTTHEQIHQVQCELCGKWLKNKLCLRKHMTQHSTVRHNCTMCNYSAVNRQCLRNHLKVHHSNEKPFTCEQCGRHFKLKNTLINHMVQHTGVRRFSCEFCSRKFASSGNYYSHRKRMHPTELAQHNLRKEEEMRLMREQALQQKHDT